MSKVRSYLSLIKFSHTIFAMPFAMIGFALAFFYYDYAVSVVPGWHTTIISPHGKQELNFPFSMTEVVTRFMLVVLCMVFARSAAMAFNRYLDREFDAKNPRTATREIPSGVISSGNALAFTIASCVLFITCCYFINPLCFYLSPVALAVVLGYSYTKRFTALCHLVLGLGLSLAPIGAYLAVLGSFHWLPVFFSLAVICWVSGFDIIYALQDEEFDRSQQLHSVPAWLGKSKALTVSRILHVCSAACIAFAGWYWDFGWLYWIGFGVFAGMLIYQHSLISPVNLKRINLAFMTANGIASVVFAIFVIADLFTSSTGLRSIIAH